MDQEERKYLRPDAHGPKEAPKPPMSVLDHWWLGIISAVGAMLIGLFLLMLLGGAPSPVNLIPFAVMLQPYVVLAFVARRHALP